MDKNYITGIIQNILNKEFQQSERRKINDFNERLNFCCYYCGDSGKDARAKRANLYWDKLFFICFNCGKKTSFDKMAKDNNEILDPNKKLEIIEYLNNNITSNDTSDVIAEFDNLIDMDDIERIF